MATQAQLSLFSRDDEASCYHSADRHGFFSILSATGEGGGKRQDSYRLSQMPTVLSHLDQSRDTWLSQAEFAKPNRRVVNLLRIGLLFADLDTYREPWARGRSPEQLAATVLYQCQEEGIPAPSLLVYSGRGLQAKWLLDGTLPRAALPRWNACQRFLIDRLAGLGADPAAKDASRVLRLVDTVNTKSGQVCRVIHVEQGPDGEPIRYSFEYLAETLLPAARWDIEADRADRKARRQLKLLPGGKTGNLRGFNARQLAWDRLEDLRLLATLRGGVDEGERMQHLFWRLNFLLLSGATNCKQMYHEAAALARELDPQWSYRSAELMTLYARAKAHEAGEKVEFAGKQLSPLYTPKNDTLISLFHITDDEQRKLRTLISRDMAKERDRERHTARRRASGSVDRATYEARARANQERAKALHAQGLSLRQIAGEIGVSVASAFGYIKGANKECSKSVRITNGEAPARA
jgi:hypothetical protein